MAKMIFVNLPVSDLVRSTNFYQAVGGEKNPQFSDDTASCMVFSDTIHVMLMTHDKYCQFTSKMIADAKNTRQVLLSLSADSRGAADEIITKGWVADLFLNGTAGAQPVGNTLHGGAGLRISY